MANQIIKLKGPQVKCFRLSQQRKLRATWAVLERALLPLEVHYLPHLLNVVRHIWNPGSKPGLLSARKIWTSKVSPAKSYKDD